MPRFNLDDYVDVQSRIVRFWTEYPDGRIETELMTPTDAFDQVVFRASVYKQLTDDRASATGWAAEKAGGGGANQTSWHENGETSAIGRALANLGYATSQKDRPSREEMAKASDDAPRAATRPDTRRYPVQPHHAQQDAPAPPQDATDNPYGLATEKQAKFIGHLLKELEWSREDATRYLDATYGVKRISELGSRQDVSAFIEHLQAVKNANQPEEVPV